MGIRLGIWKVITNPEPLSFSSSPDIGLGIIAFGCAIFVTDSVTDINTSGDIITNDVGCCAPEGFCGFSTGWAGWAFPHFEKNVNLLVVVLAGEIVERHD